MSIVGCDFHPGWQQVAVFNPETGEVQEKKLPRQQSDERLEPAMQKTSTVRISMYSGSALLLIAASIFPLLSAVGWFELYFAAATNQFYTPIKERASYHFFGSSLRLLVPATPYLLVVLLLQLGAAYALSRSALFKARPFVWGLSTTIGITAAITAVAWIRLTHR